MVPAPAVDAEPAAALTRLRRILALGHAGVLLLVHPAPTTAIRALVLELLREEGEFAVLHRTQDAAALPPSALAVVRVGARDAVWLNHHRGLFRDRHLRVIFWPAPDLGGAGGLRAQAPDFFDWLSHVLPLPERAPAFAVAGLRAAARWRPGVVWRGGDLARALAEAGVAPVTPISARLPYPELVAEVRAARGTCLWWQQVEDRPDLWRIRWALAEERWAGQSVMEAPEQVAPGWWPVHGQVQDWGEAAERLALAGANRAGLLAALLGGEPDAAEEAAARLASGESEEALIAGCREASDPGAWLAQGRGASARPPWVRGNPDQVESLRAQGEVPADRLAQEMASGLASGQPNLPELAYNALKLSQGGAARHWLEVAEQGKPRDRHQKVRRLTCRSMVLHAEGDLDGARDAAKQATHLAERHRKQVPRATQAEAYGELAAIEVELGELEAGRTSLARAAAAVKTDATKHTSFLFFLALADLQRWRVAGELDAASGALERVTAQFADHPDPEVRRMFGVGHQILGSALLDRGDLPRAQRALDVALQTHRAWYGTDLHRDVTTTQHELARVRREAGDLQGALIDFEAVLKRLEQIFGPTPHPLVATTLHELGRVRSALGDFAGARACLLHALEIIRRARRSEDSPEITSSLHELAWIHAAEGDLPAALRSYLDVLARERRHFGSADHPTTCITEVNLAEVHLRLGQPAPALTLLRHAVPLLQGAMVAEHPLRCRAEALLEQLERALVGSVGAPGSPDSDNP